MRKFQKKLKNTQPGFTLIEVVVYIGILAVISGVVVSMLLLLYRFKTVVEDQVGVNNDVRVLIKSIRDDMYFGRQVQVESNGTLLITSPAGEQIRYYKSGNQVFRQFQAQTALAVTGSDTNVLDFTVEDISSPGVAGTIQVHLEVSNFPIGLIKPEIREDLISTISLKFV